MFEELPRASIALLETEGNPLFERGQSTRFQLQILRQQLLEVLTNMHREWLVQHWHALQEKDAVDQPLGVTHFLKRFLIDFLYRRRYPQSYTLRHEIKYWLTAVTSP